MPRGILTEEQRRKQLVGIRNPANRLKLSQSSLKMWQTKDMTERNKKISLSKLGSKHPLWKGDKVGYGGLHDWIRSNYQIPELCENCGLKKPLDSTNVSGKYLRERSDWKFLCRRCHMLSDNRLEKLIIFNKRNLV